MALNGAYDYNLSRSKRTSFHVIYHFSVRNSTFATKCVPQLVLVDLCVCLYFI
jgi:hypothetical protein